MSETLIQQSNRLKEQRHQNEQGKLGAFQGTVKSVNPDTDELQMAYGPTPGRKMPVQHPFISQNSWIRSMPEVGTTMLMQHRFDSGKPEAIKTLPSFSLEKAQNYQKGLNVYRPIKPGEHDIVSAGAAHAYFGRRGNLDLRSGSTVKSQLDREAQEHRTQAPTHRRAFLQNEAGKMGDEERVGIAKRWKDAAEEFFLKKSEKFVAERYFHLKNPSGAAPAVLLKQIEGFVFDDKGQEIKHTTTAIALRSQKHWYTTTDEFTKEEIDENGNWLLSFPSTATTGYELLIPEGNYRKVIGKNRDVTITKDDQVVINGNMNYTVAQKTTIASNKSQAFKAPKTAIGDGSVNLLEEIEKAFEKLSMVKVLTPVGPAAPLTAAAEWADVKSVVAKIKGITGSF